MLRPMTPSDDCYKPAKKLAHRVVGGTVAIVEPSANRLITLNETGSEIWNRLDGRPLSRIVDELLETLEVDRARLEPDVRSFIDALLSRGLLEQTEPDASK